MEKLLSKGDLHLQNTHHPVNTLQRGTQGREHRETEWSAKMSFNQTIEEPLAAIRTGVSQR